MKIVFATLAVSSLALSLMGSVTPVHAQDGPPTFTPAMRAKMDAWRKWGDSHKNVQSLGRTMRAIRDMDKEPMTKITKPQAQKMLAVIRPWTTKPVMKDADALALNKQIAATLTMPQLKKMAAAANRRGKGGGGGGGGRPGGGGGQGGGGGRPGGGGPGGGGGGRGGFDISKMPAPREYNPLNPATIPSTPMSQRTKQGLTDFLNLLKSRAA